MVYEIIIGNDFTGSSKDFYKFLREPIYKILAFDDIMIPRAGNIQIKKGQKILVISPLPC